MEIRSGVYVHGVDVTENVLAEAELRAFIETMPQIAFIANAQGDITYFNKHWYDYVDGLKGTEGWGWKEKNIHHPDDLQKAIDRWTHSVKTGEPYEIEYRLRRHDGEYRWYLVRATPIRNAQGDILRWFGTNTDIHHQKTEQEISRLITETIPQGIWRGNPDGPADYFSERFYQIVGYSKEEFLGWGWSKFIHPEDKQRVLEVWEKGRKAQLPVSYDFRILMKDGSYRWFLSLGNPFFNEKGELAKYYGTWTDIHEQKLQETNLSLAVKSRDEFLSIASHELKTPLTSLRLQSQMVARVPLQDRERVVQVDRIKNFANTVDRQVSRLNRLVEDMLDVSRIESGKLTFKKKELNLVPLLNEIIGRMTPQFIQKKALPPTTQFEITAAIGVWDSERLEQVFTNILSNALRYGEGRPVKVTLKKNKNAVEVGVHDQGQGISREMIRKIFEKFERGDETTENTGLGLGLFISKQIIDAHGGEIEVISSPNEGSTFYVRFFDALTIS